jgi:hypothetical protein
MTRQQLSTAYANKVYALDPTSDNWREEMCELSKQYAAEIEALSRTSKREQREASTDCVFCAEEAGRLAEHQKQDHSILLSGAGQTKDAERVGAE